MSSNRQFMHIAVAALLIFSSSLNAYDTPAFNPIKWTDWKFFGDKLEASLDICYCSENSPTPTGVKASLAEPIALIDVTPIPWSFPSWGFKLSKSGPKQKVGNARGNGAFRYTHITRYPLFAGLNFMSDGVLCFDSGNFDLGAASEIKPWRNSDYLSALTPTAMLKSFFGNIVAELALGAIDCPSTTILDNPNNSFYYGFACAGPNGSNSNFTPGKDPMMEAHRLAGLEVEESSVGMSTLWLPKTSNASFTFTPENVTLTDSMCRETMPYATVKSQYWLQQVYPVVGNPVRIGTFGPVWSNFKTPQYSGDEIVFALWRQRDFCMYAYKCQPIGKSK